MTLSSFILRIVFLGLPGIVAFRTYRKLNQRKVRKNWEDFCEVLLFSLICYGVYALGVWMLAVTGAAQTKVVFLDAIFDENVPIAWPELAFVSLLGIPAGFAAACVYNRKLLNRLGRKFGVTKRYGDEDLWDYFHNTPQIEWVFVRDHKMDLTYYGWIAVYSDSEKDRELILRDVQVFSAESEDMLYNVEVMYICRDKYDLTIEAPALFENKGLNEQEQDEVTQDEEAT